MSKKMSTSKRKYAIRTIVCADGERLPLLVNVQSGVPLFEPTVWSIREARNMGMASGTIETRLRSAMILTIFLEQRGIDLDARMRDGEILTVGEIDALEAFCRLPTEMMWSDQEIEATRPRQKRKIVSLERVRMGSTIASTVKKVTRETLRLRLIYIPMYIRHLVANRLLQLRPIDPAYTSLMIRRDEVIEMIEERIPKRIWETDVPRQGMTGEAKEQFNKIIHPDGTDKPWTSEHTKKRNTLMLQCFLRLGIRRGELGGIKIRNINFTNNTVTIHRNADDPKDPRKHQPKTKTLGRALPLDKGLAQLASNYIKETRSKFEGARRHNFLFVANGTGRPIALRTINAVFAPLKKKWPDVFDDMSPHVLRHSFNDNLSDEFDKSETKSAEEEKLRNELNGWKPNSKMAWRYTRRSTKARANKVSLNMQSNAMGEAKK